MRFNHLTVSAALLAACLPAQAQDDAEQRNPAAELEAPTVEVVATTPLPGVGTPVSQVPSNVQAITGSTVEAQQSSSLPGFLEKNIGSVSITNGQANPYQPDLYFRGFSATHLLGVPQGMSVFVDGVRVNEAFGDTVNWDLIPDVAISTLNLIPGSNPVFGLNTLGGAFAVNTKSGKDYPGGAVTLQGGSFDHFNGTAEYGNRAGAWDFYIAGNYLDEEGWRDFSSSKIQQVFGKVGYETSEFDADLSYSFADNRLEGTQTSPLSLLAINRALPYTYPDITQNRLDFLNLRLSKVFGYDKILGGNVYYRKYKSDNFSSNVNDAYDGSGNPICDGTDPDNPCPGSNDTSETDTDGYGGTLQLTLLGRLADKDNKLTLGASYDAGRTRFTQLEQTAFFSNDRRSVGNAGFGLETDVDTDNDYYGLYFTDTWSINPITHLTLAGRYNKAKVKIRNVSGDPADDGLNGDHSFNRFNPAIGLNWNPNAMFNTFVGYNEGMRAPTPAELTCADPTAPCKLPNAFLADPPLNPVIAKTFELGTRGMLAENIFYSAALFRTDLRDDIQFVSASGSGTLGFFQNVGKTRRQGLELGLQTRWRKLTVKGAYSYLDATFQDTFTVASPANSSRDGNGDIQVTPGDIIPGLPKHSFKLRADYAFTPRIFGGLTFVYASDQYARGDENNQDAKGTVPGFSVVDLDARWQITDQLQLFGRVNNVFDTDYEVFGVLGENFFNGPGYTFDATAVTDDQFRTPGAPRAFYIGLRYEFGRPAKSAGVTDN